MNLASILRDSAAASASSCALVHGSRNVSYAELDSAAATVAQTLLSEGLRAGDPVALMVPNVPEFAAVYFGILAAGGVAVPLHPELKSFEVAAILAHVRARWILGWRACLQSASNGAAAAGSKLLAVAPGSFFDPPDLLGERGTIVDRPPAATAVVLYTSGTTGHPKGAELTHSNLLGNATATAAVFEYSSADTVLAVLPLSHCFGQTCALNASIQAGARVRMLDFDAEAMLRLLRDGPVTISLAVPTMYGALLELLDGEQPGSAALRLCISGGAALAPATLRDVEAAFGCELLEGYGLSETSPVASFNRPGGTRKPGSIGKPLDGIEMEVVDEDDRALPPGLMGEIRVRGANVMRGYRDDPEATRAVLSPDGWLRTGDVAWRDEDGAFFIVDRKTDLIIRDGMNIYPREIEEVLAHHPSVAEAAVIGVDDARRGEEVAACVVLRAGADTSEAQLHQHLSRHLADWKCPRDIWFFAALPKSRSGKILKRRLSAPSHSAT